MDYILKVAVDRMIWPEERSNFASFVCGLRLQQNKRGTGVLGHVFRKFIWRGFLREAKADSSRIHCFTSNALN